ncbi:MAG TPA: cobalamin-dependent protein [Thermotogota bacterium]|nr:cobalamin-dependent protein [Thermotogota bacterium]
MKGFEDLLDDFENALLKIDRINAASIFRGFTQESKEFHPVEQLVVGSLDRIGEKWELGTVSLAQVYMSGRICEELIDEYLPKAKVNRKDSPRIAIALLIDRHALGKKIVTSLLRAAGYEVTDFGDGLTPERIVEKTIESRIEILLISTLMYVSALKVEELRGQFDREGYRVKIIVGGAPFRLDEGLWERVGADAGSRTASDVFDLLEYLGDGKGVS